MDPLENSGAPVIPAGTNPTVYGTKAFTQEQSGQAQPLPNSPSTVQANAPEGTTFAELAAKKGFSSPDDMAKAYSNLESHNKKVEMTAADIIKQVYENQPATSVGPIPPVTPQQAQGEAEAIKIVQSIVDSKMKPLQEKVALQELFLNKKDAPQYANGIATAVKENPGISWEAAYKLAKFDALQQQAVEQTQTKTQATATLKREVMAGNGSPAQSRGGPDVRSIIKDRSIPFKEVDRMVREYLSQQN